jgi:NADPH-dependent curcumin reductase CurA
MTAIAQSEGSTQAIVLARRPRGALESSDLRLVEISLATPGPGEALVRNEFMSLDPSTRGRMDATEKVYTTNFEVGGPLDGWAIGQVVASCSSLLPVGATVRHRLGWRELAVVSEAAAQVVDISAAPAASWLSALGQTGFTAYVGVVRIGQLAAGNTFFVSAAAGGVGSIAGQIARLLGARQVIGSAGGATKCDWLVSELGFDAAIDYRAGDVRQRLAELAPDGLDLYFDNVGGDQLVAALHNLRPEARITLCGMVSTMAGSVAQPGIGELIQAVLRRATLRGFIVRDHEDLRPEFEKRVSGWLATGELVDKATIYDGIDAAPKAMVQLLEGGNVGKALVRLSA